MKGARHDGDFSHSLTDLMSGVAVMFLLIAAIFMVQSARAQRHAKEAQREAEDARHNAEKVVNDAAKIGSEARQALLELRRALQESPHLKGAIELEYDPSVDPRLLTIVFSRDNLQFESGECVVASARREALRASLRQIFPQVCKTVASGFVQSITLEGHTDNATPYGSRCGTVDDYKCYRHPASDACRRRALENNVRLSAARAQYVFFEAREALLGDAALAECLDKKFIVAGRGPMDPADGKPRDTARTEEENARNRRVVIRVRVMAGSVPDKVP